METKLKFASFIANLLDNQFELYGRRFGLNGVLGIIPGVGDIIPTILSLYLIRVAVQMRLPTIKIVQMLWNVIFNFLIGLLPVVGDYIDLFNHANLKNLAILKEYSKNPIIEGKIVEENSESPRVE